jgi:gamma-glutamylputrescine oxidase
MSVAREGAMVRIATAQGAVTAKWLILTGECGPEGLIEGIAPRVMPINSFLLATKPLGAAGEKIITNQAAVTDSRFVVNYFRKSVDGRLIFGGGESYGAFPRNIAAIVRRPMLKIYPQLADARIDYAWGGRLSITMNRLPFVRRPWPNVLVSAGYSGQGVMLAPYFGKLLAQAAAGVMGGPLDTLARLPCPPFPGGSALRFPVLVAALSYYALRDRLP